MPLKTHAVLIQAHKNFDQLYRLVSFFRERCDVFVHIDRKSSIGEEEVHRLQALPQVKGIYRKIAVHWGGFSILKCELYLLKKALRHSHATHFHLISGQDYPIRPLSTILRFFDENDDKEYMDFTHLPAPNWEQNTFDRLTYFFFFDFMKRGRKADEFTRKAILWQKKWRIHRNIPMHFSHLYGGSAWFSITRTAATELLDYTRRHPSFYRRLKFTFAPDETYVTSVLINRIPHKQICNYNYRFIRWKYENGSSPANLSMEHFYYLVRHKAFFARKFDNCSQSLMDAIDRYLLPDTAFSRSSTGGWECPYFYPYQPDNALSDAIVQFCRYEQIESVLEMGCGTGLNTAILRRNGIAAMGYDANPHTPVLSALLLPPKDSSCEVADLTDDLTGEDSFPLVLCIDTCGYIPTEFHKQVIRNLAHLTQKFLIVSWPGNKRATHDGNPLYPCSTDRLTIAFHQQGLKWEQGLTNYFRKHTVLSFLRQELYIFRRM